MAIYPTRYTLRVYGCTGQNSTRYYMGSTAGSDHPIALFCCFHARVQHNSLAIGDTILSNQKCLGADAPKLEPTWQASSRGVAWAHSLSSRAQFHEAAEIEAEIEKWCEGLVYTKNDLQLFCMCLPHSLTFSAALDAFPFSVDRVRRHCLHARHDASRHFLEVVSQLQLDVEKLEQVRSACSPDGLTRMST